MAFVYEEIPQEEREYFASRFERAVKLAEKIKRHLNVSYDGFLIPEFWLIDRENELILARASTSLYGDRECAAAYEFTRFLFTKDGEVIFNSREVIETWPDVFEVEIWDIYMQREFPINCYNLCELLVSAYSVECMAAKSERDEHRSEMAKYYGKDYSKPTLRIKYEYCGEIFYV